MFYKIQVSQAHVARQERDRAQKRFNDVRQLSNSLLFEITPKIERLEGSTEAREVVVKRALEYLDSLSNESLENAGRSRLKTYSQSAVLIFALGNQTLIRALKNQFIVDEVSIVSIPIKAIGIKAKNPAIGPATPMSKVAFREGSGERHLLFFCLRSFFM